MTVTALRGISSMATRQLLTELSQQWQVSSGQSIELVSVGGVDAARRVAAGEPFDFVVLAADAIEQLVAAGAAAATGRQALVRSGVAACIQAGAQRPRFGSAEEVRQAVLDAPSVGYSTGPSGTALLRLFEHWGVMEVLQFRLVQAKPGVPVASMVARGEVSLGFQQLSELLHVPGIDILGPLPDDIQITTTFTGAVCARATQPGAADTFLRFLSSPATADAKQRQGMTPA